MPNQQSAIHRSRRRAGREVKRLRRERDALAEVIVSRSAANVLQTTAAALNLKQRPLFAANSGIGIAAERDGFRVSDGPVESHDSR